MVHSLAVRVPRGEAESTRRRLLELGVLRPELEVAKVGSDILFPVTASCGPTLPTVPHDFVARELRTNSYQDLLPPDLRPVAPRAFETFGDIAIVKIPPPLHMDTAAIGKALLDFHGARAVFHDRGVSGPFRVRDLALIAGSGAALTQVAENEITLWVDPGKAYFSPRLATERARVVAMVKAGEHVVDLFGGVAPFGIQAAMRGAIVDSVDINPDAVDLAKRNVEANKVGDRVTLHVGDARLIAPNLAPADRVFMNLPHMARTFLDVAARLVKRGGMIHYHEILAPGKVEERGQEMRRELEKYGRAVRKVEHRVVRNYSPQEAHIAFDLEMLP